MKKSSIQVLVPPGDSEVTNQILAAIREKFPLFDIQTKGSDDGQYHAGDVNIQELDSIRVVGTGVDVAGRTVYSEVQEIIDRLV